MACPHGKAVLETETTETATSTVTVTTCTSCGTELIRTETDKPTPNRTS